MNQAHDSSFIKRPGTTDRGKEYEDLFVAITSLEYLKNAKTKQFQVSSNRKEFGAFDDAILEVTRNDGSQQNCAVQLKHTISGGGSLKNKLSSKTGNFSIQKYFNDFKTLKQSQNAFRLVLFTNHKFDISEEATLTLASLDNSLKVKVVKVKPELFDFLKTQGNCFQFVVECDETVAEYEDYKNFFKKFFLYTNQANVDQMKLQTIKTFTQMFSCDNEMAELFIKFVTEWSKIEGRRKKKLDTDFIKQVIAILLLAPVIKPFSFDTNITNEKLELFRSIVSEFDVVLLGTDNWENVQKIWGDLHAQLTDLAQINKIANDFQLILKPAKSLDDLDAITKTKLLWLLKKYPLIVEARESTFKAINLCQSQNICGQNEKQKFIVIGDTSCKTRFENLTVPHKLTDLGARPLILTTFKCLLKDGKEISLEELLQRNDKIWEVLTTTELLQMATDSFKMSHVVQLLALSIPEIAAMCQDGYTPLHAACIKGNVALVELIATSDIDVNGASKDGDSPVFLATLHEFYDIVKILLRCGVNVNAANKDGDTPAQVACSKSNFKLLKLLGESHADINAADKDGVAPLQVAATNGDLAIVKLLLDLHAKIDASNKYGESAIYLASLHGSHDVVRVLMEAGVKLISNEVGNGPLHAACLRGHEQVVRTLLEFNKDVALQEESDDDDDDDERLRSEQGYFVDINAGNINGNTPLHLACQKGYSKVVEVLMDYGANASIRNRKGRSPLELAQRNHHSAVVDLLTA